MATFNPVRQDNAIDEIAFAVHFKLPLAGEQLLKDLIDLATEVSDLLPHYEITNSLTLQLNAQQSTNQTSTKPSGIVCYKKSEHVANRQEWTLRVDGNRIVVACSEYSSWGKVSSQAKELLFKALRKIDVKSNPVVEAVLQCVDKFEATDTNATAIDIFNADSAYLTKHVIENGGSSWHIHQGWFKDIDEIQAKLLNNLNINTYNKQYSEKEIIVQGKTINETIVSHLIRIQHTGNPELSNIEELTADDGYLAKAFDAAHDLNKEAIRDLLNNAMLDKIGLSNA
ncbi:hypothetical protein [Sessilibacter corallicola]|uniref:TIGR04255 family protein n=1 Tax=Sessilibacter corallicola TaxID=2904075 RepID=A0ABQ0A8A5_9GAMM